MRSIFKRSQTIPNGMITPNNNLIRNHTLIPHGDNTYTNRTNTAYINTNVTSISHIDSKKQTNLSNKVNLQAQIQHNISVSNKQSQSQSGTNLLHGYYQYDYQDGSRYRGEFRMGMKHGWGTYVWPNQFDQGNHNQRSGNYNGIMSKSINKRGQKSNQWNGNSNSYGSIVNPTSSNCSFPIQSLQNRTHYTGQFSYDIPHGDGILEYDDGRIYKGQFKQGMLHGWGQYLWPNGDKYSGEYLENHKNGMGQFRWSNGTVYRGQWLRGKRHGEGWYGRESRQDQQSNQRTSFNSTKYEKQSKNQLKTDKMSQNVYQIKKVHKISQINLISPPNGYQSLSGSTTFKGNQLLQTPMSDYSLQKNNILLADSVDKLSNQPLKWSNSESRKQQDAFEIQVDHIQNSFVSHEGLVDEYSAQLSEAGIRNGPPIQNPRKLQKNSDLSIINSKAAKDGPSNQSSQKYSSYWLAENMRAQNKNVKISFWRNDELVGVKQTRKKRLQDKNKIIN